MIQGLKIRVGVDELRDHIRGRAAHHKQKASWYEGQITSLKEGNLVENRASNDPIASLENSRKGHEKAATFFAFVADHLIPGEEYELSENDLTRIEILDRGW